MELKAYFRLFFCTSGYHVGILYRSLLRVTPLLHILKPFVCSTVNFLESLLMFKVVSLQI